MTTSNTPGEAYDSVILSGRVLATVHVILGVIASFSVWDFRESPVQHLNAFRRGAGLVMIALSVLGWGPYLVSWIYSRIVLDGNRRRVVVFSIGAAVITAVGVGLYQHLFSFQPQPPAAVVSGGVAVSLLLLAKVCALIWRRAGRGEES
jgi:hypothetical protein